MNINNAHELCNLGARKLGLIEDSINTEKNRGYHYKHAFAYDWTTMQGFHYLMRLGHAINALSEFTKKLKQYVKTLGCKATTQFIKDTLLSPWLSIDWYENESLKKALNCDCNWNELKEEIIFIKKMLAGRMLSALSCLPTEILSNLLEVRPGFWSKRVKSPEYANYERIT